MLLEIRRSSGCQELYRDTGGIGGNDCARLAEAFHLFIQLCFNIDPLNHHFHNPIAPGNQMQIILKVPGGYALDNILMEYW